MCVYVNIWIVYCIYIFVYVCVRYVCVRERKQYIQNNIFVKRKECLKTNKRTTRHQRGGRNTGVKYASKVTGQGQNASCWFFFCNLGFELINK